MLILAFILLPISIGLFLYLFKSTFSTFIIIATELFLLILTVYYFLQLNDVENIIFTFNNKPLISSISFMLNKISLLFLIMTIIIFTLMFIYTSSDVYYDKKFIFIFFILQGLLSGIFITNDIFNIYVLYEVSTVVVALLIMYKKDNTSMYDGIVYLLVNVVAMSFYLLGVGYLYKIFGTLTISEIMSLIPEINDTNTLILPYCLIFTSISLKCALFPLFLWLPIAHGTPSAPCSVSAVLSGIYVKSGIYLFIIFTSLFNLMDMNIFFLILGFITSIMGSYFAINQNDIKVILAFSTVSQLGLIIMGLSFYDVNSFYGSIYHIFNHALFKSLLFLTAGQLIHKFKTRDIRKIRGAGRKEPIIFIATLLAFLGITGAPFFNGSISKYFMQYGVKGTIYEYALIIVNLGTTLIFVRYLSMFIGTKKNHFTLKEYFSIPRSKRVSIYILSFACLFGGLFGTQIINLFFGTDFVITTESYISKAITYFITLIIAIFVYRFILYKNSFFTKLDKFSVTFNTQISLIVIYFIVLLTTFYFLV